MHVISFYAAGFSASVTVVVVDVASAPGAVSLAHARDGNLWNRAARYLGWLKSYEKKISVLFVYEIKNDCKLQLLKTRYILQT